MKPITKREFVKQWVRAWAIRRMFDADLDSMPQITYIRSGGWIVKL